MIKFNIGNMRGMSIANHRDGMLLQGGKLEAEEITVIIACYQQMVVFRGNVRKGEIRSINRINICSIIEFLINALNWPPYRHCPGVPFLISK